MDKEESWVETLYGKYDGIVRCKNYLHKLNFWNYAFVLSKTEKYKMRRSSIFESNGE